MKNIYLIVGPSGSGKSSVARELEKRYGFGEIQSYTERPRRYPDEPGHTFVTPEEFDAAGKMCAFTCYNGYRYGVPQSVVDADESVTYVIDPTGVKYMQEHYSGHKGVIVIGIWSTEAKRWERMIGRGDDAPAALKRISFDKAEFKDFHLMCDAWFSNDDLEKTVKAVRSYIAVMEGEA